MEQHLPYPLPAIVQAAELSRALPDEIETRLRQLEQGAAADREDACTEPPGALLQVRGPLNVAGMPQGHPVIVQGA